MSEWRNPLVNPDDRRLPRMSGPCGVVMFGITGDLARKKLLPAIYDLANRGLLHPSFALTGFARRDWGRETFIDFVEEQIREHSRTPFDQATFDHLAEGMRFVEGSFDDPAAYEKLADVVHELDETFGTGGNHAFYLSIPPNWFGPVSENLAKCGLVDDSAPEGTSREGAWRRVVIEKPFGHDLASAKELNETLLKVFPESSIFRIDHYLGKETVQNILAMRFANSVWEPLWNAHYVDHVQITMAETIGIGSRAGYYDGIGAARDVIQNHLLQLLALTAMEEPTSFSAAHLHAEKEKVLSAVTLPTDLAEHTARGRYAAGRQAGKIVTGYTDEEGVPEDSTTETFAAIRLDINTRRWAGAPFYLRTGKRLGKRVTEIALVFKHNAHMPFDNNDIQEQGQNSLVIRVQPDEGVSIRFGSKVPGTAMQIRDVSMDFDYGEAFTENSPEAYERLILDVLRGDPPLFPRQSEVELSWKILDPVLEFWAKQGPPEDYRPGLWGPDSAHLMLANDGRTWRIP
ncbi:glucose-6-phosphate dehydrogenase [Bowdeniella nasicola]|uniref:Glucose-6-phosphate 1-dehydrogenase n=1 Tax=Bowdeniella nasicola TaxID=208480 RepID=A0A1Q5Q1X8_9ACTO|nr:glucose-6-phosphate dehydrogenase [Bowdeniella nasicola]OKL53715.1 glucose-6-phosphate dehydrogenase [Bowdeniella nasicola]